jgi:hypothetical protein
MEPRIPVHNLANLSQDAFAKIAASSGTHRNIKPALDWFLSLTPPVPPTDIVTQDEFSYDILFRHPDGVFVVYDTT